MATRLSADHRKEQLLDVAIDLFSRKGFNGTTTREIASIAGVTEAVIFRHFATKQDLYTAIIDRKVNSPLFAKWIAQLRAAMKRNDDAGVIHGLLSVIIQTHRDDAKFERVMLYAALESNEAALLHMHQLTETVVTEFRAYFARRQKEGQFIPIQPDAVLSAVVGMAFHHAQIVYIHGIKDKCVADDDAVEAFTEIALNGLRKRAASRRATTKKEKKQ